MKHVVALAGFVGVWLGGCCASGGPVGAPDAGGVGGHGSTMPAGGAGGGAASACLCDCPNGPPAPPALDTFCALAVNAGKACCRKADGSEVGACVNHECVAP